MVLVGTAQAWAFTGQIRFWVVPWSFSFLVLIPHQTLNLPFTQTRTLAYLPTKLFFPQKKSFSSLISATLSSLPAPFLSLPLGKCFPFKFLSPSFNVCFCFHFLKPRADPQIQTPTNQCPRSLRSFFPPLLVLALNLPSLKAFVLDLQESFPVLGLFISEKWGSNYGTTVQQNAM